MYPFLIINNILIFVSNSNVTPVFLKHAILVLIENEQHQVQIFQYICF